MLGCILTLPCHMTTLPRHMTTLPRHMTTLPRHMTTLPHHMTTLQRHMTYSGSPSASRICSSGEVLLRGGSGDGLEGFSDSDKKELSSEFSSPEFVLGETGRLSVTRPFLVVAKLSTWSFVSVIASLSSLMMCEDFFRDSWGLDFRVEKSFSNA